ncbi:MAG: VOC family protein [Bryobacteraceae bacterium]
MTANKTQPVPKGFHSITPHIIVKDAAAYVDFLKRAFNAVEHVRMPGPGGKLMHVQVQIGDSQLMFGDHFPEFGGPVYAEGHWPLVLHLYVPDADKAFAQALAAGCKAKMPLEDQFWGDRYGHVADPFGFTWAIATHKEDLTPEEMQKRQAAAFAKPC